MSPDDKAAVMAIGICVGILAVYRTLCWLLDRHIQARRQENAELARWQDRAKKAAADVDAARAARDLKTCLAIWDAPQHDIPHQTRRTEEDQ